MFSRNLAVIIGINSYKKGISSLKTAVNDAKKLVQTLREKHQYQVWVCLDEVATLSNLNRLLEETLPAQVTEHDRLLFYFAGHGVALNGDDGPAGYLIPQDASLGDTNSYLPMTKLHDALTQLPCRHFLGILDCCFAGAFRWSSTRDLLTTEEVIYQERYDRFIRDAAWQIITSSASDQKALDNFNIDSERGQVGNHSPFAAALLKALEGAADIYPPAQPGRTMGDGVITATELYIYLRECVEVPTEKYRRRQTPGIWSLNKHDKGEYIFLSPGHELNLPPAPVLDESQNPYRGLQAFEEEHSQLFFGRQALIKQLYQDVYQQSFTVVLGASGTGKSSLVKAGLIPYIKQLNQLNNGSLWYILSPMRPGEAPLKALNNIINTEVGIETWLQENPQSKLLLFIDQGEELLTLCRDEREREDFLQLLTNLLANYADNLRIILTLRNDFETLLSNSSLEPYWYQSRFIVPPMTREELRACIEEPASARVMYFDPYSLVDRLIDEVSQMPGALPLLSFTLSELYLQYLKSVREGTRNDRVITQADYEQLGGLTRSLTQRADREHDNLVKKDTAYAQTIRKLMLRMVAVGGEELARRRVALSELEYPEPENTRIQEVIRRFTDARLLVEGQDALGKPYVEPAHDALVRGWQKLLLWKQDEEESIILQRRLTPAAVEWQSVKSQTTSSGFTASVSPAIDWLDRGICKIENIFSQTGIRLLRLWKLYSQSPQKSAREKPKEFLWNGNPYLDVLKWQLNSQQNWFNKLETEFVRESVLQKRRNASWRWRITLIVFLILSALTFGIFVNLWYSQKRQAETLRQSAEINLGNSQSLDGMIEILQAGKILEEPVLKVFPRDTQLHEQIEGTLQRAIFTVRERNRLEGYERPVRSVVFSHDGQQLATSGDDGTARLWSLQGKELQKFIKHKGSVRSIKFSPKGEFVATAGDGFVRLSNLQGKLVKEWDAQQGQLLGIELSQDGRIATAGNNGTVRLWNLEGQLLKELVGHQKSVKSLSFSPDGQFIASGGDDGIIYVWNFQGQELEKFTGHQKSVSGLSFSRDSQILASSGEDGFVRVWKIDSKLLVQQPIKAPTKTPIQAPLKKPIQEWNAQQRKVWDIKFSPDSKQLATAGGDGTVRVWNLQGKELEKFVGHTGPVRSVSFSRSGQQIASSSDDTTVRIWDLQGQETQNFNNNNFANSVGFGGNERQIISGAKDGTISLYNLQGQQQGKSFTVDSRSVSSMALSRDGQTIVTGSDDGKISLWNLQGQPLGKPFPTNSRPIKSLAFSPDGKQILSGGSDDGKMYLWNLQGQPLGKPFEGHLGAVNSVAFSQDGKQIVSGGDDGTIRLWNRKNEPERIFQVYGPQITAVSFTPDSKKIISSDSTGRVLIWNLQDRKALLPLVVWNTQQPAVNSIRLSTDGQQLTTIGSDGSVKLWSIKSSDELIQQACKWVGNYLKNNSEAHEDNLCHHEK